MSELLKIKEFLQLFLDSTWQITNFGLQVIDQDGMYIAAAGSPKLTALIGKYVRKDGAISRWYLKGTKRATIFQPGEDQRCVGCAKYGSCDEIKYSSAAFGPIELDGTIIGVIGVMPMDDISVDILRHKEKRVYDFVESLSLMISNMLLENHRAQQLASMSSYLSSIISSMPDGVIVLDSENRIVNLNKFVEKHIGSLEDLHSRHISAVFSELTDEVILLRQSSRQHTELQFNKQSYLAELTPVTRGSVQTGTIITITESTATYSKAWSMTHSFIHLSFQDIIGQDPAFTALKNQVESIAPYDSTVLLIGETGTGKELFARAIHNASKRKNKPFIVINCGAIPEPLIESELFGYEKGAFTGASSQGRQGKFFLANGGTLFLDEVENMPLYMQQKLLRVLETGQFERIGGSKSLSVDVRIVTATNVRLEDMVEAGTFRKDLYHRLSVIPFLIPPLRNRGDDLLLLSTIFIDRFNSKYNKNVAGLSEEVLRFFRSYSWEGNIRELQNTIEYAVSMCETDTITQNCLPYLLSHQESSSDEEYPTLETVELNYIRKVIHHTGWDQAGRREAARILGISQATIYRKLKEIREI